MRRRATDYITHDIHEVEKMAARLYRHIPNLVERGAEMVRQKVCSQAVAARALRISRDAIRRAVIALNESRVVGAIGRPSCLTEPGVIELRQRIDDSKDTPHPLTMLEIAGLVRLTLCSTPSTHPLTMFARRAAQGEAISRRNRPSGGADIIFDERWAERFVLTHCEDVAPNCPRAVSPVRCLSALATDPQRIAFLTGEFWLTGTIRTRWSSTSTTSRPGKCGTLTNLGF